MLDQAVDDTFAERWLFEPMGEPNILGAQPDPDRVKLEVDGIFTFKPELAAPSDVHGVGKNAKFGLSVPTGEATLSVASSEFVDAPRQGDRFTPLDRVGEPAYRAVAIAEDGTRLVVTLQELASRERGGPQARRGTERIK